MRVRRQVAFRAALTSGYAGLRPGVWSPTPKIYGVPFAGSENTPPDLGKC